MTFGKAKSAAFSVSSPSRFCTLIAVQRHHFLGCATTTSEAVSFFGSRPNFSSPGSEFPGFKLTWSPFTLTMLHFLLRSAPHDSACLALLVPHKTVEMSKVKLHFISKIALGLLWSPKGKAHATSLWYVCRRRFRHGPLTIESYGSAPPPPRIQGREARTRAATRAHPLTSSHISQAHATNFGFTRNATAQSAFGCATAPHECPAPPLAPPPEPKDVHDRPV